MRIIIPTGFLFLLLCGCVTRKKNLAENDHVLTRYTGGIHAVNLSENGTAFSSKNDEIVFLNYFIPPDTALSPVSLNAGYFVFDSTHTSANFSAQLAGKFVSGEICMLLIEIDDDRDAHYYDSVCVNKLDKIKQAHAMNNINALAKIFGDDDLLGIQSVPINSISSRSYSTLVFEGLQLFEKFRYEISIKSIDTALKPGE